MVDGLKQLAAHWDVALMGLSLLVVAAVVVGELTPKPVFEVRLGNATAQELAQLPTTLPDVTVTPIDEVAPMPALVDVRGVKAPALVSVASSSSQVFRSTPRSSAAKVPMPVNINTASANQLERLPGVGPKLALRIIEFRRQHGGFKTVDDLLNVSGIGPGKLAKLRQYALLR